MDAKLRAILENRVRAEIEAKVREALEAIRSLAETFPGGKPSTPGKNFMAIVNSTAEKAVSLVHAAGEVLIQSAEISKVPYSEDLASELRSIIEKQVPSTTFASTLSENAAHMGCPELAEGGQQLLVTSRFLSLQIARSKIDVFVQGLKAGALTPQPLSIIQQLTWFRLNWRTHWRVSLVGLAVIVGIFLAGYLVRYLIGG